VKDEMDSLCFIYALIIWPITYWAWKIFLSTWGDMLDKVLILIPWNLTILVPLGWLTWASIVLAIGLINLTGPRD
jgi:hypothetical protein